MQRIVLPIPVLVSKIDYLFLSHAHINHIGRVPELLDARFRGEIMAVAKPPRHCSCPCCMKIFALKQGITFKVSNAGHILRSCFILFSFPVQVSSDYRVIFSGDLGCTDTPILPDPDPPEVCDFLVMESTYGDRNHPERKGRGKALRKLLEKAITDQ